MKAEAKQQKRRDKLAAAVEARRAKERDASDRKQAENDRYMKEIEEKSKRFYGIKGEDRPDGRVKDSERYDKGGPIMVLFSGCTYVPLQYYEYATRHARRSPNS